MNKTISCLLTLILISTFACFPAQKNHVGPSTQIDNQSSLLALRNSLNKKIQFINSIIEKNNISNHERTIASDLLRTYQSLQNRLTNLSGYACTDIIHKLVLDLSSVDEKYFTGSQFSANNYSETINLFSIAREDILDSYMAGDFFNVINLCIELKTDFGPESLTPDIGLIFAISLAKKQLLDDAIEIGEKIALKLEASPDIVQLRINIAEWYLQQGQLEKATSAYEKLADTQDERESAIRLLNRKIDSAEKSGPDIFRQTEQIQLQKLGVGIEHLLERVGKLLEDNRFNEARNLLLPVMGSKRSADETIKTNLALKKLEVAEENYLEKKISMLSMKRGMEQAQRLLEEEKYEEVILKLEAIEKDQGDDREINELKKFTIEKLITQKRNKAAKSFLAAKRTGDLKKKEEYLREALKTLKNLIEKYPESPSNKKLRSNMKTVQEKLDRLP